MTHPYMVAENWTTHPYQGLKNWWPTPSLLWAHPPPILFDQSYKKNLSFLLQQRARENREARKKMISDEYRFIMGIVASYIDLEVSVVEEFIVDSEEVRK